MGVMQGEMDIVKGPGGYRWTFTSVSGASYLGPKTHKTKKAAIAAGESWLASKQ